MANTTAMWTCSRAAGGSASLFVGHTWVSHVLHTVQTYGKTNCQPVEHHRNGRTRNQLTLVARHAAMTWNGVTVADAGGDGGG